MAVLSSTKQWDVTTAGLEGREYAYLIEKDRLVQRDDHEKDYSWIRHIGETKDVSFDLDDFTSAYLSALTIHRIVLSPQDVELIQNHHAKIKRNRVQEEKLRPFWEEARRRILGSDRRPGVILMDEIERDEEINALAEKLMAEHAPKA